MADRIELADELRLAPEGSALERRKLYVRDLAVRAVGEGDTKRKVLEGLAAVFDEETQIGPDAYGWLESIEPGAFAKTIKNDDIRALFNHDASLVLGRTENDTLALREDKQGLRSVITPPATATAADVVKLVEGGFVTGMSIGFSVRSQEWTKPEEGSRDLPKRRIREVTLYDVGPVTFPAYPQTTVTARDQARSLIEQRDRRPAGGPDHRRLSRALLLAEAEGDLLRSRSR